MTRWCNSGPKFLCARWIVATIILTSVIASSFAFDVRYWVWQRADRLEDDEIAELAAQNVATIYWQVGELEETGETWYWKARFDFPNSDKFHFIPTVRLVSHEHQPFSDASIANLVKQLTPIARNRDELQLDYDAPDRVLSDYSAALKRIHQITSKLTITALPRWSRPEFSSILQPTVDELLPMLYDFEAEPILQNESPLPLIAPEKISQLVDSWRGCGKTWRAGLPIFARLSVYDSDQKLRGQIRNWNWDELCFNRSLQLVGQTVFGAGNLRAKKPTVIANTRIKAGEKIIVRQVDRTALRNAITRAERAGAQSAVFFRLPDSSASSGWSLRQIGHLDAQPRLNARYSPGQQLLELSNDGDGDLEPGLSNKVCGAGGYVLELESNAAIFREAHAGEFVGLTSYAGEKPVAVPFATRLQFKFSQLRARQKITTGLIQLAPGADFREARYRILNLEEDFSWKKLE